MRKLLLVVVCLSALVGLWQLPVFRKSEHWEDVDTLPDWFCGKSHRVSATKEGLMIEVDQILGLHVANFSVTARDGSVYLSPVRISSGGPRRDTFHIRPPVDGLPEDWQHHAYWVVQEYYSPFWQPGYRDPSLRKPGERCRIVLSEPP